MKKRQTQKTQYVSKLLWMLLSLLVSIAFWTYVASQSSDEFSKTIPGVSVQLVNEDVLRRSHNLVITDLDVSTVTLTVTGPRRVVSALTAEDLTAQIDVSRLSQAAYTSQQYTVVFPDGPDTSSLQVTARVPETVNFMVSSMTSKTLTVRGSFEGDVAEGFMMEPLVFEPSTVKISGPDAYLKNVDSIWVEFGEDVTVDQSYSVETGFILRDKAGEELSTAMLSFSDEVITATVPILAVKDIPLTVNLIEGAGATEANTKVTIEPQSITLAGDSAYLAGKNRIVLGTIDLTDFYVSFTDTYTIPLDDDIQNLTGVTEAKVTVEIVGLQTKSFTVTNLSFINLTPGYEAEIISESVVVTLRGSIESMEQLTGDNIRAVADLTDYKNTTGALMAELKFYIDGYPDVGPIGNAVTVSIEIRRAQT